MRRWVLGVVALACATAGCSSAVAGAPATVERKVPEVLTAEAALGDLRSLDACSLIEPDTFEKFGSAEYGYHYSLEYCEVEVGGTAPVTMSAGRVHAVGDLGEWTSGTPVRTLDGDLSVVQGPQAADHCVQFVVFPDDLAMAVDAYVYEERTVTEDLCGMTAAAVDGVVHVLTAGAVRHRELADNSFGLLDACELTTSAGLAPNGMESWPSGHRCVWNFANGDPSSIEVTFGSVVTTPESTEFVSEDVAGRRTLTGAYDGWCEVWTEHIPVEVEGHTESGYVETASVIANGSTESGDRLCQAAMETARKVWPALPAS